MFPELISLNSEELQELKTLNDDTLSDLQNDIKLLKWQLTQFGPSATLAYDEPIARRYEGLADSGTMLQRLQDEIAGLNSRLRQTNHLSGITIEKISRQVLELNESHSKTHFKLTLKVMGKVMYLKYEIDELLTGEDQTSKGGRVTWMEIQIDRDTNKAIGDALTKAIEDISIQSALRIIKSYVKFVSERERLIQHFLRAYPDSVTHSIDNDLHCLNISDSNPSEPLFNIEWNMKCKSASQILPEVHLKVKGSQKLRDMDDKGVFERAPDMFAALVKEKGLQSAIECIIELLVPDQEASTQKESE